jgi:hypothetical protein
MMVLQKPPTCKRSTMMKEEKPEGSPGERDDRIWIETVAVIILSLATIATAWCAYQSARWSGLMTINFNAANAARAEAVTAANYANAELGYDSRVLIDYAEAYFTGDTARLEVLEKRFIREELDKALQAWLALDPANNPEAPRNPILMPEYQQASSKKAESLNERAAMLANEAEDDNQLSDNYVLLTVVFASVLFFAGISTKFSSQRAKVAMVLAGSAVLLTTVVVLILQPIR